MPPGEPRSLAGRHCAAPSFPKKWCAKRGVTFHTQHRIATGRVRPAESCFRQAPHTALGHLQRRHAPHNSTIAVRMPPASTTRRSREGVAHRARASRDPSSREASVRGTIAPARSPKRAMLEGHRVSRISVRGFAVASATAVTTVGAVVGVASGSTPAADDNNFEAAAADTTLLADIPAGQQAQVQTASLTQQADAQASAADAAAKKSAEETARIQAAKDAKSKKQAAEDKAGGGARGQGRRRAREPRLRPATPPRFSAQGSYTRRRQSRRWPAR